MSGDSQQGLIEVRNRFDGRWSGGYRLDEIVPDRAAMRYRVRRCSDGTVIPVLFDRSEIRPVTGGAESDNYQGRVS